MMWSKLSNQKRPRILVCGLLLLALIVAVAVGFLHTGDKNTMEPSGKLTVRTLTDGSVQLTWPENDNATGYKVQVMETDGTEIFSDNVTENTVLLPQLPSDREVNVRVTGIRDHGGVHREIRKGLIVAVIQPPPRIRDLNRSIDDQFDTVDVSFDMSEGDVCHVYLSVDDAEPVLVEDVRDGALQLRFGVDDVFPLPEYGQQYHITFRLERSEDNGLYADYVTEGFILTREDFLGRTIQVAHTYQGNNVYTFTWSEAKGQYYDLRLSEDGGKNWMTMAYIPTDGQRSYTTPCLKAFTDYQMQVVTVGGQTQPGGEVAAESEIFEIHTDEKFLYSTIWPIMDRKVYANPNGTEELGRIPAGSAWCVLGQEGQYLKIRYNGRDAYVDGEYCMIDLAEYLGNLCEYDITNSYSSIYLVHEYGIRDVSGTVISGYENVCIKEDEYLVPLLFPTAQKLMEAGLEARARGYRLKIYDSFRPQQATDSIYWKTYSILGQMIPDRTYSGKNVGPLPVMSYKRLMTNNGAFEFNNFLAPGTSRHNFGVALDLTLVDEKGEELSMQTSMHDLSWYSARALNNDNAKLLYEIMTDAGFWSISSEWWHYQDNEIYNKHLYRPLKTGVSWQCWVADRNGWRYRLNDGSFYANRTETIDGQDYTFDENGYLVK